MIACPKCGGAVTAFRRRHRGVTPATWESLHADASAHPCQLAYSDVLFAYTVSGRDEVAANEGPSPALKKTS